MIDPPKIIGARLRALRKAVDCKTQVAFAKSIGVEKNTYNPWEKGERPLTFEGALLIRKRYRIPLDYLFFGEGEQELPAGIWRKLQDVA
jgi:transcriptional regulator with XRE-family HTH domain